MRALLAGLLLALPAAAAAVTVTAEVDKVVAELGDQIVLAVTVSGAQSSLPKPRVPALADFEVYESGTNQSFSFVNGRVASQVTYTFVLSPRRTGRARVPPISVEEADGRTVASDPIDIEIVPAGKAAPAPPPAGRAAPRPAASPGARPEVFLAASLDKTRAYAGEQVTLTMSFETAVPLLGNVSYDAPKLEGFLTEDLGQSQGAENHGGRTYHATRLRTALFPVHGGRLSVGSAQARTAVARGIGGGGDLLERFFNISSPEPLAVRSEPVAVEVLPLPEEGKPADFSGAVGRYALSASVDRAALKVGEAATLTVVISGTGNMRSVGEPKRPELPALRFFDTESSVLMEKKEGVVGGVKTLKTVFVPRASGEVVIPALALWYFDPARKAYAKAESRPLRLKVEGGAPGAPASAGPGAPALGVLTRDIRYLKAGPMRGPLSRGLESFAGLGAAHALPFLALLGAAGASWRRRRLEADPAGLRARGAAAKARAALAAAQGAGPQAAPAAAAAALAGFVADRHGVSAAGLTLKSALALLSGSAEPARALYAEAWRAAEAARFAPPGAADAAAEAVLGKARAALDALEGKA